MPLLLHSLVVFCEVTLDQKPSSVTVYPGHKSLKLDCTMPGMGSYTMIWYRQTRYGTKIEFLMKEHESPTEHFKVTLSNPAYTFSLEISNLTLKDSGTYYCAASHSAAGCTRVHTRSLCLYLSLFEGRSKGTHQLRLCVFLCLKCFFILYIQVPINGIHLQYLSIASRVFFYLSPNNHTALRSIF